MKKKNASGATAETERNFNNLSLFQSLTLSFFSSSLLMALNILAATKSGIFFLGFISLLLS